MKASSSSISKGLLSVLILGIVSQHILVVQSLEIKSVHKKHHSRTNETTEDISFDQVWELMYDDLMRWMAIFEDVLAESLREQFFDGIVDRKTVKRALRFFARNLMSSMKSSGFMERFSSKDRSAKTEV
jgi:hypothetical protein